MQMGIFDRVYGLLEVCDYMHLFMVVYAYICSMVKDRIRAESRSKYISDRVRPSTACGYGAFEPLTYR